MTHLVRYWNNSSDISFAYRVYTYFEKDETWRGSMSNRTENTNKCMDALPCLQKDSETNFCQEQNSDHILLKLRSNFPCLKQAFEKGFHSNLYSSQSHRNYQSNVITASNLNDVLTIRPHVRSWTSLEWHLTILKCIKLAALKREKPKIIWWQYHY